MSDEFKSLPLWQRVAMLVIAAAYIAFALVWDINTRGGWGGL